MNTGLKQGTQRTDRLNAGLALLNAVRAAVAIEKPEPQAAAPVLPTVPINDLPGKIVEPKLDTEREPFADEVEPTSEQELAQIVQKWVVEDADSDSEPMSQEEMVEELKEIIEYRPPKSLISEKQVVEIVKTHAPNAPAKSKPKAIAVPAKSAPFPPELEPLVKSGIASFEDGYWLVNRCDRCGQFKNECCGRTSLVSAVRQDEQTLTNFGRQAVGLDPIKPPKPPKSNTQIVEDRMAYAKNQPWWNQFRGAGELEGDGTIKMYIENFLPEGTTLICGLPKEGKSFLALSVVKALTTGKPLFGRRGFEVPEAVPVLYLAAESGDGALKLRCKKFGITEDKTRFIARTLTQGPMFGLNSPEIESVVQTMRPIVVLETLIRFNDGKDEDDASENRKLAEAIFRLIAWGAPAVVGIHHSRKDVKANPTKEAAVRGSGDGLAMTDAVWLVLQDEKLFQGGRGPNEVDLLGWGRDFTPWPMRLALTQKAPKDLSPGTITYAPGIVSCIDTTGNIKWVDRQEQRQELSQVVEGLITEEPSITREKLVEKTGATEWDIKTTLKGLGYYRPKGGKKGAGPWQKKPKKVDSPAEQVAA